MHLNHKPNPPSTFAEKERNKKRLQDKHLSKKYKVLLPPHLTMCLSLPLSSCTEQYVHFTENASYNPTDVTVNMEEKMARNSLSRVVCTKIH